MSNICGTCNEKVLVTHKRIKCSNCDSSYHQECANSYSSSPATRPSWVCPACIAKKPKRGDNSNTPVRALDSEIKSKRGKHSDTLDKSDMNPSDKNLSCNSSNKNNSASQSTDIDNLPKISTKINPSMPTDDTDMVLAELRSFRSQFTAHQKKFEDFSATMNKFNKMITALSKTVENMQAKVNRIDTLEQQVAELSQKNLILEEAIQKKEQFERKQNIEITGVPQKPHENLNTIIENITKTLDVHIDPSEIEWIHRVRPWHQPTKNTGDIVNGTADNNDESVSGTYSSVAAGHGPARILLRVRRRELKDALLTAARQRRRVAGRSLTSVDAGVPGDARTIFLNDHLTPYNKTLLAKARKISREKGYAFCWVNRCKIYLRQSPTSKSFCVESVNDLEKIK